MLGFFWGGEGGGYRSLAFSTNLSRHAIMNAVLWLVYATHYSMTTICRLGGSFPKKLIYRSLAFSTNLSRHAIMNAVLWLVYATHYSMTTICSVAESEKRLSKIWRPLIFALLWSVFQSLWKIWIILLTFDRLLVWWVAWLSLINYHAISIAS